MFSTPSFTTHGVCDYFPNAYAPAMTGEYSCSRLVTQTRHPMIPSPCISIMRTRSGHQRDGTHAHNSRSSSRIQTTRLYTQFPVRFQHLSVFTASHSPVSFNIREVITNQTLLYATQMHITASSQRSVIGVLRVSASYENSFIPRMGIAGLPSKTNPPTSVFS